MQEIETIKTFIKNRTGQRLAVIIDKADSQKGLAFVMHGLGDNKESAHIRILASCFSDNGYTVVRLDAANTFGESEGDFADANITNYYEDYEDVIDWSRSQSFYEVPFILCGHSLGALSSAWYAGQNPDEVKSLVLLGSPINFNLSMQMHSQEEAEDWQKTGYLLEDWGLPEKVKIKWSYMEEKKKYDLLKIADRLVMPILLIVGELDDASSPKNQQILFDRLPEKKELYVIKGSPHTFREEEHLKEIYNIMDKWIKNL